MEPAPLGGVAPVQEEVSVEEEAAEAEWGAIALEPDLTEIVSVQNAARRCLIREVLPVIT